METMTSEMREPEITYASLCIYGENLQPEVVTTRLKCAPTSSLRQGEPIRKNVVAPRGVWRLCSQQFLQSDDTSEHIVWLADKSGIDITELRHLQREGYEIRVYVFWLLTAGNGGPVISLEALQRLLKMGAELHVDVYFDPG
jgi:hypothetical protein